jgi:membrane protein YdbS with pleckstrin-like domain
LIFTHTLCGFFDEYKKVDIVAIIAVMDKRHGRPSKTFDKYKNQISSNPLASFAVCPTNTRFATQEAEERIILLLRQHPIVNVPWIFLTMILLFAPLILDYVPIIEFLPINFQIFTLVLWYLMVLAYVLGQFLYWYFNVYIVTDERIVDIDFFGMIYTDVSVTKIDKIQDMTFVQAGLFGSIFNYGDVFIQTAGEQSRIDFMKVPRPAEVVEIISELIDEERQEEIDGRVK